ncbi:MAG: TetR/AcrR family transcriptional regulator [Bacteroidales bacterium]
METRERILAKASEMLTSLGVRNVTMDALSASLGMSKRTIYEHFRDKEELVIESIRYMITEHNKVSWSNKTGQKFSNFKFFVP